MSTAQQSTNYVTPQNHSVRVHHIECLRDGGILDRDDLIFDVFDEQRDQILAIYDEPSNDVNPTNQPSTINGVTGSLSSANSSSRSYGSRLAIGVGANATSSSSATAKYGSSKSGISPLSQTNVPVTVSNNGDVVVEIKSLTKPPSDGLRVSYDDKKQSIVQNRSSTSPSSSSAPVAVPTIGELASTSHYSQKPPVNPPRPQHHSAMKSSSSPRTKHRVTISADNEQCSSIDGKNVILPMSRTSARKSRLTDSFFDAIDRLDEAMAHSASGIGEIANKKRSPQSIAAMESLNPGQTVIVLTETEPNKPLGLEITPVYDSANSTRLMAVEVRQIDPEGRVAEDGRIQVGDHITEINQRPVYQMSISRARAYLHEMQSTTNPSLTIDRPISTFTVEGQQSAAGAFSSSMGQRPLLSALQQANTTALGTTFSINIVKESTGFGFTITSRETTNGERLFYIGTVKANGAAVGKLKSGDRLLQMDDEKTSDLSQNTIVERLKQISIGDSVTLLISRLSIDNYNEPDRDKQVRKLSRSCDPPLNRQSDTTKVDEQKMAKSEIPNPKSINSAREEILLLNIPLNETGSAGLGVSLKARAVLKPNGIRQDCGIFIKKVLHGGAAYKDGRLQVNDQLIGIEDIDLIGLKNSEASDAITKCLKAIGPSAAEVSLRIARDLENRSSKQDSVDGSTSVKSSSGVIENANERSLRIADDQEDHAQMDKVIVNSNGKILKKSTTSSDDASINAAEDLESVSSHKQRCASEDELSHVDPDAFNRENPTRRSISEKRHLGMPSDASKTSLFQKIKHNRQISAPSLRTYALPSATAPEPEVQRGARSLREKFSVRRSLGFWRSSKSKLENLRSSLSRKQHNTAKLDSSCSTSSIRYSLSTDSCGLITSPKRRSMSFESMEAHRNMSKILSTSVGQTAERFAPESRFTEQQSSRRGHPNALKRAQRSKLSQAVPNAEVDEHCSNLNAGEGSSTSKALQEPYSSLPREMSRMSKEKQQRRKSVGSSLLSKISQKFGASRSREASPEKQLDFDFSGPLKGLRKDRIRNAYEQHHENQFLPAKPRRTPPSYQTFLNDIHSIPVTEAMQHAGRDYRHSCDLDEEIPIGGYIRVANSKFYRSVTERSRATPIALSPRKVCPDTNRCSQFSMPAATATGAPITSPTSNSSMMGDLRMNVISCVRNSADDFKSEGPTPIIITGSMVGTRMSPVGLWHPGQAVAVIPPDRSMSTASSNAQASNRFLCPSSRPHHMMPTAHTGSNMSDFCRVPHRPHRSDRDSVVQQVPIMRPPMYPTHQVYPISSHRQCSPSVKHNKSGASQGRVRPSCVVQNCAKCRREAVQLDLQFMPVAQRQYPYWHGFPQRSSGTSEVSPNSLSPSAPVRSIPVKLQTRPKGFSPIEPLPGRFGTNTVQFGSRKKQ